MKNALLIIDAQFDFCDPKGSLFVPNAEKDMEKLKTLIINNVDKIDHICVTLDSHPVNDISHPNFWEDKNGNLPVAFTQITAEQVKNGEWKAKFFPELALKYLENLEKDGKFPHLIWPEHCLEGSRGAAIDDTLMEGLKVWTKQGKQYQTAIKGTYPLTEHFGIFMAQIPDENHPETQLNISLIDSLMQYNHIYLAGEAKSHCVATSLQQALDYAPELAKKMIIIEDCMSDVPNMGHYGLPIYQEAKQKGLQFVNAVDIIM
ncbi:MAG: nicotinamidase [Bacteroidetes bacterium]|nr:MAG: nicotinamidase [Bacteroidota bacterium]TAG85950.1 MAG: nicotinamidase [Bacteroidota bacterium]